jgi:hypothetical protein
MRATKISKYFEVSTSLTKNPLDVRTFLTESPPETIPQPLPLPIENTISTFDTLSIHLVTLYQPSNQSTLFALYFPNTPRYNVSSEIKNINHRALGDLQALYQSLKYIIYHPNLFEKINKYNFILSTTSDTVLNVHIPNADSLQNSKLYFKIQSLIKCIKQFHIEHSDKLEKAFDFLKNQYGL